MNEKTLNETIEGAIASKINGTPKDVYLPVSKLHSILTVANLLVHNNISKICYCGQISLQSAAVNCIFLTMWHLWGGNIYFAGDCTVYYQRTHIFNGSRDYITYIYLCVCV